MTWSLIEPEDKRSPLTHQLAGIAFALLGVAISTIAGLLIVERWGNEPVVLLFIPPVLAIAVYWGLWPALAAAVGSALAYNYHFTAPYHSLVISKPADIVTVLVLFVVAAATSHLAGLLRAQARLAASHAKRNATIAGFAGRLLSCAGDEQVARVAVQELAQLFQCQVVLVTDRTNPKPLAVEPDDVSLAPSDIAAAAVTLESGEPAGRGVRRLDLADWQFRPVLSGRAVIAAVGMAREDAVPPVAPDQMMLLGNLFDQLALALERTRLENEAREVARLRERDKLRSSLLLSIGEDVKPRLNAIGAAARALRRSGEGDKTLIADVAAEIVKLDRYIDALVDVCPGGSPDPLLIGNLTIDVHRRTVLKDGHEVHLTPKEYSVLCELAKHAGRVLTHAHLLKVVWGPAQADQIDYLRVAIRALRQKLEDDPAAPALILNEPAIGYRLVAS